LESTAHLKFAVNGNGDTSGHQKWQDAIRKVHHFHKLFMQQTDTLPFPEWEGQNELNWSRVVMTIREHAYGHYQMEIQVQHVFVGYLSNMVTKHVVVGGTIPI
jgi:hypothetical protein